MHVRAEAPQLDLLTLTRLDRERIRIDPLVCGHVRRVMRVRQDVEHGRIVDDGQKRHRRHDLFENIPDLSLDLGFGLWGWSVRGPCYQTPTCACMCMGRKKGRRRGEGRTVRKRRRVARRG